MTYHAADVNYELRDIAEVFVGLFILLSMNFSRATQ
jgi:hypothetical protein